MTEISFSSDELSDLLDWASDGVKPNYEQINRDIDGVLFPRQRQQQQQQQQQQQRVTNQELERHRHARARETVYRAAWVFTQQIFAEIHDTLCVQKKLSEAVQTGGTNARAITTAIAAGLAASVGLSGPISISVATFALVVISRAGLNAFCVATKGEILEEMEKADKALCRPPKRTST